MNTEAAIEVSNTPSEAAQTESILDINHSDLFGSWLFSGGFIDTSFSGVNPEYRISQGDQLLLQLWGGIELQQDVTVDAQGQIFIPRVGPVRVSGVANKDLNQVVLKSIKRVYKENVEAYVTLASSQTVKVFVTGMVEKPGIYEGQSADSVLRYIDKAGGIKEELGSYRNIQVKRNNKVVADVDLYQFLNHGDMPQIQLQDGDLVFVGSRVGLVAIEGLAGFQGRYELADQNTPLENVISAISVSEQATHVTVVTPDDGTVSAAQYKLGELKGVTVKVGSTIKISSQLRSESISVAVLGEHNSAMEMVLPWGATLKDLLDRIEYTALSNKNGVQLFREEVARRQKDMLMSSLSALEQSVLTAPSATKEAAELRQIEAQSVLSWIEKAKQVKPRGQVLLSDGYDPSKVILVQGDKVVIPAKRNLVMIHGEVLFPTAITYDSGKTIDDYIEQSGGATRSLGDMNTLVMKANGSFVSANKRLNKKGMVNPGDEIFVLAKPELKALQLTKDISQVIYQIAVSAAVALAL
ncbi:polysaccharide biosynthesis/export family protein [Oceanobacter mangrovi]|uniref:polysaccharide biosynthesis/export family protein n=1 Tax=Oceanobacter mangrovi TaxID=2862510 RepID=UPI001FE8B37B|nr:polysaccharide biosynthesis/export family protein [Oceanobacter mangrovi]